MKMNLKVNKNNEILKIKEVIFDESSSCFLLKGDSEEDIQGQIYYPLDIDQSFNESDYEIHFFYNNKFVENDIYQVYERSAAMRVGWVFPLQALLSNQHVYATNAYFLKYAFVAYKKLIFENHTNVLIPDFNVEETYSLKDFYDIEETLVMILSKTNIVSIVDFDINNYVPHLYSEGYYFSKGHYKSPISNEGRRLYIESISEHVKNDHFITPLFKEILLREDHHLVKFYLLYQVIELLIEKIFDMELSKLITDLSSHSKTLFQIKENLSDIAKEKERIQKLFTVYTSDNDNISKRTLMNLCNAFLDRMGRKQAISSPHALYGVRNFLVHEYRSIPVSDHYLIDDINDVFEKVIIALLKEIR